MPTKVKFTLMHLQMRVESRKFNLSLGEGPKGSLFRDFGVKETKLKKRKTQTEAPSQ